MTGLSAFLAKILIIGHSLVGPDLPPAIEGALNAMGQHSEVQRQVINGAPLRYNWENSAEAEGTDARAALQGGMPADMVILTEAQPLISHLTHSATEEMVANWSDLARAAQPSARVFIYETWPSRRTGPGLANADDPESALPWGERIALDHQRWQSLRQAAAARGQDLGLIPAGLAFLRLEAAIAAGQIPGVTSLDSFFSDDIHLSGSGIYFVALVHAAALTGASPEGLPPRLTRILRSRDQLMEPPTVAALQRIAWQTVSELAAAPPPAPAATAATAAPAKAAEPAPAAPPAEPAAAPAPPASPDLAGKFAPIANDNLGFGLAGVHDWGVQQPFLDLMKTARPWIGHLPGQWGGWGHDELAAAGALGPGGWPLFIPPELVEISTVILSDLPEDAAGIAGRYQLSWAGRGRIALGGRAQNVRLSDQGGSFDVTPGPGSVILTLQQIDPADPIRDIRIIRQDRLELAAGGALFNPDWLDRIRGARLLRFMDWMATNDSRLIRAEDLPQPGDYTWARSGVPMPVMLELARQLDADAWFNIPHAAEDALAAELARQAAQGLLPGRRAWVEYSNEVWNWQFAQAHAAEAEGRRLWGVEGAWLDYYVHRSSQIMALWAEAFAAQPDRLVRVLAVQTGALGMEQTLISPAHGEISGPLSDRFDAYAVTGYFAALLGFEEKLPLLRGWLRDSRTADPGAPLALAIDRATEELRDGRHSGNPADTLQDLLTRQLPYHAAQARDLGLELVMYEGGSHVVGIGPTVEDEDLTRFFIALNYSAGMGELYRDLLRGWQGLTDAPFNAFVDVYSPGKWGSWGALRHLGDDNPRWRALTGEP